MATSALPHSILKLSGTTSSSHGLCSVPLKKTLGRSRLDVANKRVSAVIKGKKQEYSKKAIKALGFTDMMELLGEKEVPEASNNPSEEETIEEKEEKMKPEAPDYKSLLKELSLELELNKGSKEVLYRAGVKKKLEALETGLACANDEDLIKELEEEIINVKKEVELELIYILKSMDLNFNVSELKSKAIVRFPIDYLKFKIETLNLYISKRVEKIVEASTDLKDEIELLNLEMVKAGETPDVETKNKIEALRQQITQKLDEVLSSSPAVKKHQKLKDEIVEALEFLNERKCKEDDDESDGV